MTIDSALELLHINFKIFIQNWSDHFACGLANKTRSFTFGSITADMLPLTRHVFIEKNSLFFEINLRISKTPKMTRPWQRPNHSGTSTVPSVPQCSVNAQINFLSSLRTCLIRSRFWVKIRIMSMNCAVTSSSRERRASGVTRGRT